MNPINDEYYFCYRFTGIDNRHCLLLDVSCKWCVSWARDGAAVHVPSLPATPGPRTRKRPCARLRLWRGSLVRPGGRRGGWWGRGGWGRGGGGTPLPRLRCYLYEVPGPELPAQELVPRHDHQSISFYIQTSQAVVLQLVNLLDIDLTSIVFIFKRLFTRTAPTQLSEM